MAGGGSSWIEWGSPSIEDSVGGTPLGMRSRRSCEWLEANRYLAASGFIISSNLEINKLKKSQKFAIYYMNTTNFAILCFGKSPMSHEPISFEMLLIFYKNQ